VKVWNLAKVTLNHSTHTRRRVEDVKVKKERDEVPEAQSEHSGWYV